MIVLGDLLIDELLEGKPERISREAPVIILEHVDTELNLGGAANAAHNVAALGGVCHAIGVTGRDAYHQKLAGLFDQVGITHSLVQDATRPTTVKTRILSKSHALSQQLLRLDRICHDKVSPLVEGLLIDKLSQVAHQYKVIVVSDYRGGLITDGIIRACKTIAAKFNLMVIVDAQDHLERFQDVLLMTPNQPDTEKMVGFAITDKATLASAGEELLVATGVKALLITRGGDGMALFQAGKEMVELPAFNKSEVFDVTGAGDTVVATMALALSTGCSFVEAMALGNLAAGIVVKKQGTAVTNQQEMLEHLELVHLSE
ncbi:MAG: bifunctional hydroxymethylpyrimidine kinase/phosphomethylpyrimidine kinase [Candidatus Melainabacteria bacterium]|nr:bifunctional hydroxymethylpyrimidine kinase/phosphomethylpyrimidine kinase [Candidatus Melainabacteria bacterium]